MTDQANETTSPRRKRGTGFPVVSLADAARILKDAGKYGFEHPVAAFASYMGHSTTNSGAFRQRMAAFRDWNLVTGRGETVSLTDTARRIALPESPDAERQALKDAFESCAVMRQLYDGMAKGQALERAKLASRAVHDLGVSPSSTEKFVDSFTESAMVAGLAQMSEAGDIVLLGSESRDRADVVASAPGEAATARGAPPTKDVPGPAGAPVVRQTWAIDGGTILFEVRADRPLPAGVFATVGEVVSSLEQLAATLAPAPPADPASDGLE